MGFINLNFRFYTPFSFPKQEKIIIHLRVSMWRHNRVSICSLASQCFTLWIEFSKCNMSKRRAKILVCEWWQNRAQLRASYYKFYSLCCCLSTECCFSDASWESYSTLWWGQSLQSLLCKSTRLSVLECMSRLGFFKLFHHTSLTLLDSTWLEFYPKLKCYAYLPQIVVYRLGCRLVNLGLYQFKMANEHR